MRRIATGVVSCVLALLVATPALANVYEVGSVSCSPNLAGIQSKSTGHTYHWVDSPGFYGTGYWNNGASIKVRRSVANHQSIEWIAEVFWGDLYDIGTHGYCTSIQ